MLVTTDECGLGVQRSVNDPSSGELAGEEEEQGNRGLLYLFPLVPFSFLFLLSPALVWKQPPV